MTTSLLRLATVKSKALRFCARITMLDARGYTWMSLLLSTPVDNKQKMSLLSVRGVLWSIRGIISAHLSEAQFCSDAFLHLLDLEYPFILRIRLPFLVMPERCE